MNAILDEIRAEIRRLELHETPKNRYGLEVYADDDLPAGWVRLDGDGGWPTYGPASVVLETMRGVDAGGPFDERQGSLYTALACCDEIRETHPRGR